MGTNGSENFKTLLLLEIAAKSLKLVQKFPIFNDFFSNISNSPL